MPLVSVVIPTYNSGLLLREAIDSVLAQTFQDYEIIIIDDGSTDDTYHLVHSYDNRVYYYRQVRSGSSVARQVGISKSRGQYIAALDADDIWLPKKLEYQVMAMEADRRAGLCYTDGYRWTTGSQISSSPKLSKLYGQGRSGWQFSFMFKAGAAATSSMLFRREAYEAVGGYDVDLRYCDAEFLIRMAAQYPLIYLPEQLMAYRIHGSNTSSHVTKRNAISNLQFLRLIRTRASARIQPDIGDLSVRVYRYGPSLFQWVLLLIWRLRYASYGHTLERFYRYATALIARD